ncbi:MAG: tRNA (guanosine(46)-N7)-methyltransferase TrmB [Bacteroidales bacterium]|nr:tRNA (guanosine(46)-N7)-methyltransferase TrmB [Bacteroidales bacterium]
MPGKNKLQKFADNEVFPNVIQPTFEELFRTDHSSKGKWATKLFGNSKPVCLELGCGRGEYTVALGGLYAHTNFIGIDVKGARIWQGAKRALDQGLPNVAFIRTRIDFICSLFSSDEVDEIWITFPDPQPNKSKKRLTSTKFMGMYQQFVKDSGLVHLKTDNQMLYRYTYEMARQNGLCILKHTNHLYESELLDETLSVKTYYEKKFLEVGKAITYLCFQLPKNKQLVEPEMYE